MRASEFLKEGDDWMTSQAQAYKIDNPTQEQLPLVTPRAVEPKHDLANQARAQIIEKLVDDKGLSEEDLNDKEYMDFLISVENGTAETVKF